MKTIMNLDAYGFKAGIEKAVDIGYVAKILWHTKSKPDIWHNKEKIFNSLDEALSWVSKMAARYYEES